MKLKSIMIGNQSSWEDAVDWAVPLVEHVVLIVFVALFSGFCEAIYYFFEGPDVQSVLCSVVIACVTPEIGAEISPGELRPDYNKVISRSIAIPSRTKYQVQPLNCAPMRMEADMARCSLLKTCVRVVDIPIFCKTLLLKDSCIV